MDPCRAPTDGRPTQFEIVNLSSHQLPDVENQVLQLGLTFCPDSDADRFTIIKDIHLFARRLMFKTLYDKPTQLSECLGTTAPDPGTYTLQELRALDDLMELWDEGCGGPDAGSENPSSDDLGATAFPPPSSFKLKSSNFPLLNNNPNMWAFVQQTTQEIENHQMA